MILTINTAQQNQTTVAISRSGDVVAKKSWKVKFHESEKLLPAIDKLIKQSNNKLTDLKGIIVVIGPGGFSALRIGITIANTLAYTLKIPITGVKLTEFNTLEELLKIGENRLYKTKSSKIIAPFYGKEPNITKSKNK